MKSVNQLTSLLLFVISAFVQSISCGDIEEQNLEEIVALTRDHRGRADPDALLNGFIPVWAVVIYTIAGASFVMGLISATCWLFGCRNPHKGEYEAATIVS